jgi:hypothetical protein
MPIIVIGENWFSTVRTIHDMEAASSDHCDEALPADIHFWHRRQRSTFCCENGEYGECQTPVS